MSWRFAVVADTHLGRTAGNGVHNPGSGEAIRSRLVRLGPALAGCEFAIHLGDVIDNGEPETIREAAAIFADWPCPVRLCLGNHDAMAPGGRERWAAALPTAFGNELHYSFLHRGLRVAVLQSWWLDGDGAMCDWWRSDWPCIWQVPDEQLSWLDSLLAAEPDVPTVVVNHPLAVPLVARLNGVADIHSPPRAQSAADLLTLLRRYPAVTMLLGGHAHAHQIERRDGLWHVATGCVSEYPYEYRTVTVDGVLTVETCPWPGRDDEMIDPSAAPAPWVAGQEQDRRAVIPLGAVAS